MFTETIIKAIEHLRGREEFKNLTGVSKTIVNYLLNEVKEALRDNKLVVKGNFRRQKSIPLFEIIFSYNDVYISTLYKDSSSHIKYIKEYKENDYEAVMQAIETVCAILNWSVELYIEHLHQTEREMKIGYNIPEEANP